MGSLQHQSWHASVWEAGKALLFALLLAVVLPGLQKACAEERALRGVALVIGQSAYEALPALANPQHDAEAIDDLLSSLGFEVDLVRDADRKKLARSVERFVEDAADADVALLYYSGHGIEAGGENFLLPTDTDDAALADAGDRLVPLSRVLDQLQAKVPVTIALLDACRSNPFPPGTTIRLSGTAPALAVGNAGLGTPRGATSLAAAPPQAAGSGAVLGFAAAPGHVALDGAPGENSPYAAALLKHLSAGDYAFGDVMTMVTEEVYLKTDAKQTPWTNTSLRKVLYFGEAADDGDADEASIRGERRKLLLTMSSVPDVQRRQIRTVAAENGVPMDALFAMLKAVGADTPQDPAALAELLDRQAERISAVLAERSVLQSPDPEIARLASLASQAVEEGALDAAIRFHERAKQRVEQMDATLDTAEADLKARRLEHAAVFASSAQTYALAYDNRRAAEDFAKAYEQAARWDDKLALRYKLAEAQAWSDLGFYRADTAATARALAAFRDAAALAPVEKNPGGWADTQSGLAIALWSQGERRSDTAGLEQAGTVLRQAIADPALDALPESRARLQTDLALVLLSLGMRQIGTETLLEGVDVARAALIIKTKADAPQEWARLQNHLGATLFVLGLRDQSRERLLESEKALRAALEVWTPQDSPLEWSNAQNNLGLTIGELGTRDPGSELLLEAVDLLRSTLEVRTRELAPLSWAESLTNLAATYHQLGVRDSASVKWFDEAVAALDMALAEITRERDPLKWAAVKDNRGLALSNIAERTGDAAKADEAIATFRLALTERTRERVPLEWASSQTNLANALYRSGEIAHDLARHREAIGIYTEVLKVRTREADALGWARTNNNLANVYFSLGTHDVGPEGLRQAAYHYDLALEAYPRDVNPIGYADTKYNLALLYLEIGKKTGAAADFETARQALKACVEIYHSAGIAQYDSFFTNVEASIEMESLQADIAAKLKALEK